MTNNPYEQFKKISFLSASDLEAVVLLYKEAINSLNKAEENFLKNNQAYKDNIEFCRKIIQGLRSILNFKEGKEIAMNLYYLYSYFDSRLLVAKEGIKKTPEIIADVRRLLTKLMQAWIVVKEKETKNTSQTTTITGPLEIEV